jgi:hypothetical protein
MAAPALDVPHAQGLHDHPNKYAEHVLAFFATSRLHG